MMEKRAGSETSAGDSSSRHVTTISVLLGFQPAKNSDPFCRISSLLTRVKAVLLSGEREHGHRDSLHARLLAASPLSRSWA
jgi:hypothetical protein